MRSAEKFKTLGNNCMKSQDFNAAIDLYKSGLNEEPDNPVLNCNISQAYLHLQNYVEAEKFAKKAIELKKNYVKAYYRAAKAALGLHNLYDSMLNLAEGVQNCASQELDDLFALAREISEDFEVHLRNFREKEKAAHAAAECTQGNKDVAGKDNSKVKSGREQETGTLIGQDIQSDNDLDNKARKLKSEITEREKLMELQLEKNRKLEKQLEDQEVLLRDYREGIGALERNNSEVNHEAPRLEKLKKQEPKIEQRSTRSYQDRGKTDQEVEERELEMKIKEQEKKLLAMKEQERKLREKRERGLKEQELREQERDKERREHGKVKELEHNMKEGSSALTKGLNRKAVDSFKKALDSISSSLPETIKISDMDVVVLQYAYSHALIFSDEYNDIVKAIQVLEKLEQEGRQSKLPAVFLLLGKAYIRLNRFKRAKAPLERGISLLKLRGSSFARFSWPGTIDVIEPTDTTYLQEALESELQLCKLYHKPDAVCFYENCLAINQHLVPSRNIFFSDLDFAGFVEIVCQEKCHVHFHLTCWKDFKERLSEVEKFGEKDILGRDCLTPDCMMTSNISSVIIKVLIVGSDGEEKSSYECAPPTPATSLGPQKDCVTQTLKKKQRKKHDKTENVNIMKRVRHNSKSKKETPPNSAKQGNSAGSQLDSALAKLVAARDQRFGYDIETPDRKTVMGAVSPLKLGQNEEFVYTYFLEIFKAEGYMSIFKLQQHWETNREHMPPLEPAIITHTDLVKFLLDTGEFAVVHDMIGLVSELHNLTTIVESKCDAPLPMAHDWNQSSVGFPEAAGTLPLCNTSKEEVEGGSESTENRQDQNKNYCTEASSCSSDTERDQSTNLEESDEYLTVQSSSDSTVSHENDRNQCGSTHDDCSEAAEMFMPVTNSVLLNNNSSLSGLGNVNDIEERGTSGSDVLDKYLDGLPPLSSYTSSTGTAQTETAIKNESSVNQSCAGTSEIDHSAVTKQIKASPSADVHSELTDTIGQIEAAAEVNKRLGWKPGVKIMSRISEKFPGESRERLVEALGIVRVLNNSTLSGLTYDVIEGRVQHVLQSNYFLSTKML